MGVGCPRSSSPSTWDMPAIIEYGLGTHSPWPQEGNHCSGLSKCHSEKCPIFMPFAYCGLCMKRERSLFSASSVPAAYPPPVCLVGTCPFLHHLPIQSFHPFIEVSQWCALLGRRHLIFTSQITDTSQCFSLSPPPCPPLSFCVCVCMTLLWYGR